MLLEHFSAVANRGIAASTRAQELCSRLDGKAFEIAVQGAPFNVFIVIEGGALRLSRSLDRPADAGVSGTPLGLLSLLRAGAETRLRGSGASIQGDAETAEHFYQLMRAARPELEEELSRLIGDVAAHQVGNLFRDITGWGRQAARTTATNIAEYLQEESRDLVPRAELQEFLSGVDELREGADRLEARLNHLTQNKHSA